ncbi:hypothetical protein [Variovorax rhizosphaerae]|uniref:Uncharacterized protein n=1 Tax=Variovorax rhizosphaerae TaxID=1836200 RepID=A0ABU8WLM8_9BURK
MSDSVSLNSIAPALAEARLQQSLALVDFFVSLWSSNPALAKQAGRKVEEFMMPRDEVQRRHAHDLD